MLKAHDVVVGKKRKLCAILRSQPPSTHNLKVIGSNPIPQPNYAAKSKTWRRCR
jgi:hypothetical protein